LSYLNSWYREYSNKINIVVIYISEAHARDEWPLSLNDNILQHKTIEDRIEVASNMKCLFSLYCDSFEEDNFESRFLGWPERAYIVEEGILKFVSIPQADGYDDWHIDVQEYLKTL
jgi:hypothetical protein